MKHVKKFDEMFNENIIDNISSKWDNNEQPIRKEVWVKGFFDCYTNDDKYSQVTIPCINDPKREITVVVKNTNVK